MQSRPAIHRITCYIRPHRLEAVKSAIASLEVTGLSVADVRGCGNSPQLSTWGGALDGVVSLPIRSRVEVVAPEHLTEAIVQGILENAWTGEPDDGKIFVEEVQDAIRVRTNERGVSAV